MPPTDLHALARVLGALLPQRTRGPLLPAPHTAHALADRLATACLRAGLASQDAVRIANSITRYLLGGIGATTPTMPGSGRGRRSSNWRVVPLGRRWCSSCRMASR